MDKNNLYTIGFTKKRAEEFFNRLIKNNIKSVIDVRLNNVSQLAGFAKKNDLIYFLKKLCNCNYKHIPLWAPTKEILNDYKKKIIDWSTYEVRFNKLINDRKIEGLISKEELNKACLLCSEPAADKCHRRLVAEYLQDKFGHIHIEHL